MPALKPRCYLISAILSLAVAAAQTAQPRRAPDVPYVPTTQAAVEAMLQLASVNKADIVYDLGCGDGRIVIAKRTRTPRKPGSKISCDSKRTSVQS